MATTSGNSMASLLVVEGVAGRCRHDGSRIEPWRSRIISLSAGMVQPAPWRQPGNVLGEGVRFLVPDLGRVPPADRGAHQLSAHIAEGLGRQLRAACQADQAAAAPAV